MWRTAPLVERLSEAGCDDDLVGIGQPGRLALEFTREAGDAGKAVRSALADVLAWLQAKGGYSLAKDVLDVARVALQGNVAKGGRRLARPASG